MATGCDVIITGIGDCGSCSASAVADGIAFEAAGLPAAAICSDAFGVTADAMAELRGAPGYRTRPRPTRWPCSPPTRSSSAPPRSSTTWSPCSSEPE